MGGEGKLIRLTFKLASLYIQLIEGSVHKEAQKDGGALEPTVLFRERGRK
jgi:hypothetical protein